MTKESHRKEISREEAAAEVLYLWEENQYSLRTAIGQLGKEWEISQWQIQTAIHSLVFETMRRLNTIDFVLNQVLEKSTITELDPLTRNILRVAAYLILYREEVPALVTNEAVSIIKRRRNKRLAGFCNAVLRKVQQINLEKIITTSIKQGKPEYEYCVPQWLFKSIEQLLGPEEAQAFLSTSLQNPSVYIRVNTLKSSVEQAIPSLEKERFRCTPSKLSEVYKLEHGNQPIVHTTTYHQHLIYLQSLASALVSRVLNPQPSDLVLDLCAAPGSKTSHIAQLMNNQGNIFAIDNMLPRVQELERNLSRLGVHNTHIIFSNSFQLPFREGFQVDSVLIDPPCSNTGVIQTRPEVKWTMTPDKIRRLQKVQASLLREGVRILAPGGFAVYSTCSVSLEENEHLIRDFLASNSNFELVLTKPFLGSEAYDGMTSCQRLFPHTDDTEGFFIAKLRRKISSK
ncbi:MAG: 16S rRNA (cytosine(967)-C(5))-methyltransferase RsmB [Candidatus Hermodarchaeota archaeon]